jgi:hypothetical protein
MQDKTHHPDVRYSVDLFRPEDAQGIVRLFEADYGKDYPINLYYDPESAYSKEKSASGRVTTLLQFRCFPPRTTLPSKLGLPPERF